MKNVLAAIIIIGLLYCLGMMRDFRTEVANAARSKPITKSYVLDGPKVEGSSAIHQLVIYEWSNLGENRYCTAVQPAGSSEVELYCGMVR